MKSQTELAARLAKQWQVSDNRETRLLSSDTWPLSLSIGKPTPTQLTQATDQVRSHLHAWRAVTLGQVVYETVTFRGGAEPVQIPVTWQLTSAREWVAATRDALVQWQYDRLQRILHASDPIFHRALVRQRSLLTEPAEDIVIAATRVALRLTPGCAEGRPLRSLSALGVDSKFLERHRALINILLDARFDGRISDIGLEAFLGAPEEGDHWLLVAPLALNLLPFEQQRVRASELRSAQLPGSHLLIVENEQCLHQLPQLPDTVAVLGSGLHLEWLRAPTLQHKQIAYWGDLDTWGLTLLAKARTLQPHLTALLMDRNLFDAHRPASVPETTPAPEQPPEGLTAPEQTFYRYLRTLERGRIEQEFLPRDQVVAALQAWRQGCHKATL